MTALTARPEPVAADQVSRSDPPPPATAPAFIWRVRHAAICALLTAFALASSGGAIVADTKLDLVVDPVGFLGRATHLWDAIGASGQLQNQAYGYLFPMGPFFALSHLVGVPGWVAQRLWWALVLCVAYTGVVALARRLGIGTPASRMLAGVAFAVSPHVLTVLGPVSAEAWPMALSAWVLVPLVVQGTGARPPRRAAFLSGLAVLCMGGVNATLVLAALVPALAWFLTRRWDRQWVRLAGWWALAVLLACFWWLVPLLQLGRFSPPFLDYIESASITTSTTSLVEVLRGTHDWIAYLPASGSTAGAMLLTSSVLVVLSTALAAAGLAGLAARSMPHRAWMLVTLGAGVVLVTLGHVAAVDGVGAEGLRTALDGPLAPLRNVHKFDVALRLPLVLGLAAVVDRLSRGRSAAEARANRALVLAAAVFAVGGAAVPLLVMKVAPPHGFASVPGYWEQAAQWLDHADARGRALLQPGSRFGVYDWGTTNDEPLQSLAHQPWDVRNAIPLTTTGHIRWLDSVEQQVAAGRGGQGLTGALQRSGVRYVVVRNDLDYGSVGATSPLRVHQALAESPDLVRVATFGPEVGSRGSLTLAYDQFQKIPYPAIEIFEVQGGGDPLVQATPLSQALTVTGGPESLVPLADLGLLAPGTPAILGGGTVLTDTPRRRETNFAAGASGQSSTLSPSDPLRIDKPTRDYQTPVPEAEARIQGVRSLTASSSAADADALPAVDQSAMPFSAVDHSVATAWRPNPFAPVAGQWLAVDLGRDVPLRDVRVSLVDGSGLDKVTVSAGGRTATTKLGGADSATLAVPVAHASSLRVELGPRARGVDADSPAGIVELTIPGVRVTRTVVLPGSGSPQAVVLTTSGRRDSCVFTGVRPLCASGRATLGEDAAGLDRSFALDSAKTYAVDVTAVPMPGPALDRLIAHAVAAPVTAKASSTSVADPSGSAASAVDGDTGTAWIADPADPDPRVELRWKGKRAIGRLSIVLDPGAPATRPTDVTLTSPAGNRIARVDLDGQVRFQSLRTDRVVVHLRSPILASSYDPAQSRLSHLGLGVSELVIPGVHRLSSGAELGRLHALPVTLPCGAGPTLQVDGTAVRTSVETTVDRLRRLEPATVHSCGAGTVSLASGTHRVRLATTATWGPDLVVLRDTSHPAPAATRTPVAVTRWDATHRGVRLGPSGEKTLLTVHENANPGWRASVAGVALRAVTVDGWQQGFVVPANAAASVVTLDFTPDRWGVAGLWAGGLAALLLLLGAVLPGGRREAVPARMLRDRGLLALGGLVLLLVGGWAGVAVAAAGTVLWALGRRRQSLGAALPWLAAACLLAAGVRLAFDPWGTAGYAAGSRLTQWLCLLALGVAFAVPALVRRGEPAPAPPPPSGALPQPVGPHDVRGG